MGDSSARFHMCRSRSLLPGRPSSVARIVFSAAGLLGDVAPFVGPANAMARRGHDVVFLTPAGFHPMLAGESFELLEYPLDFSPAGMRTDHEFVRLMRHPWLNQTRLTRYWMRKGFLADRAAANLAMHRACDGADLLVTHPIFGSGTIPVARSLGVPSVVGHLFPMLIPTDAWSPPLPDRSWNLGRQGNRWAWRAFLIASGLGAYDRDFNRYRRDLGFRGIRGAALMSQSEADRVVVLGSHHYYGGTPADWADLSMVGFSRWSGPRRSEPDPRLEDYLSSGDPPVLVCLGTAVAEAGHGTVARVTRGLRDRGMRPLVIGAGVREPEHADLDAGVFRFVPIDEVAPRCAAAVVSGAIGTLAAVLTARRPVVVLPQLFDQLWHGRRVEALGVGAMATRTSSAAPLVEQLIDDEPAKERVRVLGDKLARQDGAAGLVTAAEQLL